MQGVSPVQVKDPTNETKTFLRGVSVEDPFARRLNLCRLTHCRLIELPHIIYWKILILVLGMSGYVI